MRRSIRKSVSPSGSALTGNSAQPREVLADSPVMRVALVAASAAPRRDGEDTPRLSKFAGRRGDNRALGDNKLAPRLKGGSHVLLAHEVERCPQSCLYGRRFPGWRG